MTNKDKANHGGKHNQDVRIAHQLRNALRREIRQAKKLLAAEASAK